MKFPCDVLPTVVFLLCSNIWFAAALATDDCFIHGAEFSGDAVTDALPLSVAPDAAACQRMCRTYEDCFAWVYFCWDAQTCCHLKKDGAVISENDYTRDHNYISGLRTCAGDFQYIGCFQDSTPRALSDDFHQFDSANTLETCAQFCSGYDYFGVQTGSQCFCGNSGYDAYGRTDQCTSPCYGDFSERCGGSWANSVYALTTGPINYCALESLFDFLFITHSRSGQELTVMSADDIRNTAIVEIHLRKDIAIITLQGMNNAQLLDSLCDPGYYDYIGCFQDNQPRALGDKFFSFGGENTIEKCAEFCYGYQYFGVQTGSQCFCGNSDSDYDAYGESDRCTSSCYGDFSQTCGGSWANSVYNLKPANDARCPLTRDGFLDMVPCEELLTCSYGTQECCDGSVFPQEVLTCDGQTISGIDGGFCQSCDGTLLNVKDMTKRSDMRIAGGLGISAVVFFVFAKRKRANRMKRRVQAIGCQSSVEVEGNTI